MEKDCKPIDLTRSVGRYVAVRREQLGMTPDDLALLAGVSLSLVSSFEDGTLLVSPGVSVLERIAMALELKPHQMMALAARMDAHGR